MYSRLVLLISYMLLSIVLVKCAKVKARHGPHGMSFNDTTTCPEFSKYARFNPYSVLYEKWFVFFYWGPTRPHQTFVFTFPTSNHTKFLHKLLDGNTILPVDWRARQILMEDHRNDTSLLVERSDRGEYWQYLLYRVTNGRKIKPLDIRLKQTGDNRILGFMDCDTQDLLAMSRINDVPPKKHLKDEAARLGFRGRRGKSYLYQGHEWMPIPEDDEKNYWQPKPEDKDSSERDRFKASSEEVKSIEQSSEEVASQSTPQTTHTQEKPDEKGSNIQKEHKPKENSIPEESQGKKINSPEKSKKEEIILLETSEQNENISPKKLKEKENQIPDNFEENENKEEATHQEMMGVDENDLKARCVEIPPEPWDSPEYGYSTQKPENVPMTKQELDHIVYNNELDVTKFPNIKEKPIEQSVDKSDDGKSIQTDKPDHNLNSEDPQLANDPQNQYIMTTDKPYEPANTHTRKYLDDTVEKGSSTPIESISPQNPSELASQNKTNEPVSP